MVGHRRVVAALGVLLVFGVGIGIGVNGGHRWSALDHRVELARLAAGHGIQIAHTRAQVMTSGELVAAMAEAATEDRDLIGAQAATIAALRGELRSTSRIGVVLIGETTEAPTTPDGQPLSIGCRLGGVLVGTATINDGALTCATLDLRARVHLAVSDTDAAALVEVSTGEEWTELPSSLTTTTTGRRHRVVSPEVRLGLLGGGEWPSGRGRVMPALSLAWLHPTPDLDLLGVRVAADATAALVGVDAACYRIGAHLPVVEALRLCAGVGYTTLGAGVGTMILEVPL
mgnify:CR=1 FL=1